MIYLMEQPGILEEYGDLLSYFPQKRREKLTRITNPRARSQGTLAFVLLCFALWKERGIRRCPKVEERPLGKPYFPDHPDLCFNLSHSDVGVLCALSRREVGADVQGTVPYRERLAGRILSPAEAEYARGDGERLTLLWTLKESYLKYQGTGIRKDLRTLDLSGWAKGRREENGLFLSCFQGKGYAASVFSEEPLKLCKVTREEALFVFRETKEG